MLILFTVFIYVFVYRYKDVVLTQMENKKTKRNNINKRSKTNRRKDKNSRFDDIVYQRINIKKNQHYHKFYSTLSAHYTSSPHFVITSDMK